MNDLQPSAFLEKKLMNAFSEPVRKILGKSYYDHMYGKSLIIRMIRHMKTFENGKLHT